jgi:hypothetical protein
MSNISTQLGEFQKWEKTTVGKNNLPAVNVHYRRLDGEDQKDMSVRYIVGKLDKGSQDVLRGLKAGDHFVVVKKKEGEYWNLDSFKPVTEWKEKPKKQWNGNQGQQKTYDDTGVKVGAARNQAIAALSSGKFVWDKISGEEHGHVPIESFSLDDIDAVAYEIVKRQAAMEENVRNGTYTKDSNLVDDLAMEGLDEDDDLPPF